MFYERWRKEDDPDKLTKKNESTVRYVYGDSTVDMIIDSFGFSLEIEETVGVEESQVAVTSGSRTDYCCWRLYKHINQKPTLASLVFIGSIVRLGGCGSNWIIPVYRMNV